MARLVLVRHGESSWNAERRIQGQQGTGLSERGQRQAELTATWMGASFAGARVVASDLERCLATAEPIAAAIGAVIAVEPGLRERDFGRWSGQLTTEVHVEDPELAARWRAGEDIVAEVGGEGTVPFTERVVSALRRIAESDDHAEPVVCVTHGGPIWHGVRALVGVGTTALGPVANCSITELEVAHDGTARLITWNQSAHLPPELRTFLPRAADREAPPVGR